MECQAKRLKHRCFPVEFAKFLKTEVYERPILKPAVSPGVSFFISYTCGSNWYLAQQTFVLMKTSWRCLSSSSSEDVLIKTNMFALALRLQKTSSRRLQDVLVKTNIFVLAIRLQDVLPRCLQDVFKTSSRRLAKTSSRHLQDVFKMSCKDIFKTFSRRIIRLNCLPRSHFWVIYGQCRKFESVIKISQVLA